MASAVRPREEPKPATAPLYSIVLRLEGLPCLVVGGGPVAARKAASLIQCGARVTVVAPRLCAELEAMPVTKLARAYEPGEAAGYRLVITATGRSEIDNAVFEDGEKAGVMVNAADNTKACRFFLPAVVRRGPVTVAVSTAGSSPYLATWLRHRISTTVGPEFAELATLLGGLRRAIKDAGCSTEAADWASLLDEDLVAMLASGHGEQAEDRANAWLSKQLPPVERS
ncbi:MAG: bifunctional precorrin-2 dehydrogenase/sirohydrochlorin ferrochelatase [Acidimicrobiales bacterium]